MSNQTEDLHNTVQRTVSGGRRLPDAAYHRQWLDRVVGRCVVDANGCWIWQGMKAHNGYGQTGYRAKTCILHRRLFQIVHGVTLKRREYVLHTCDVKLCCNPAHLWKGNNGLNKKDETAKGKNYWRNRTHCPHGHKYTPENTRLHECRPGVFSRGCITCERIRMKTPEYIAWRRQYQRNRRAQKRAELRA